MSKKMNLYLNPKILLMFFMGISSGLPLLLVTGSTLQAWMVEEKVDLGTIGLFALVGLPYTLKFLWAPFFDLVVPPFLGRRRGWMILTQVFLLLGIVALSRVSPSQSLGAVAFICLLITFFSASQDIVLDAYRVDVFSKIEQGLASSVFVSGYRVGMYLSTAGALLLAEFLSWNSVYLIFAAAIVIGIIATLFAPTPKTESVKPRSLKEAFLGPLKDYFTRKGAYWILAFILLYKVGDSMASSMTMPFYLSIGFSKADVVAIVKSLGLFATIGGGLLGGVLIFKLGLSQSLILFGILQAASTFGFSILSQLGKNYTGLTAVIMFENITAGMGTAAFTAFMAVLCNSRFTATQFALLSSLMGVPRVILSAPTGYMAQGMGWFSYFIFCTLIAAPGMLILLKIYKWGDPAQNKTF